MSAIKIIQAFAKKSLTKNQGSGIINLPGAMQSEAKAGEIVALLQRAGIPMNQLDDFIRSEADVAKFLNIIEAASKPKVYSGQAAVDQLNKLFPKKGEVVQFPQKTSFKEQVEAMKKSGDIVDPNNLKKNDKILQRDMFNNSSLNQPGETNIFSNKYLNDLDKKIIDSDAFGYSQKEWNNLSNSSKEKFRRQFDSNYEDAMENTKMAPIETIKTDTVTDTITYIKTLKPMDAMKEANFIIGRKGKYKDLTPEQSKRILKDTEDHIFERDVVPDEFDPEYAKGGRAGFYTGGITDVEPSLDDIGHGADALNARTRLMSPGNQATTSTGLNYLLAEDNDNMRIPFGNGNTVDDQFANSPIPYKKDGFFMSPDFSKMTDEEIKMYKLRQEFMKRGFEISPKPNLDAVPPVPMPTYPRKTPKYAEGGRIGFSAGGGGRRAFLKLIASLGGTAAAFKTGILGLGEGGTKKAVTETVKQAAGSGGQVPPYFLKLVSKIKTLGDETVATKDKTNAYKYKDYTMEEDFAGNIEITKKGIMDEPDTPEVFMSLKVDEVPLKGKKGSTKVQEYEEFTGKRDYKGDLDVEPGVPDSVVMEIEAGSGNVPESFYTGPNPIKKADGGRIGFSAGGGKFLLSKLGINSTSRRFLEKVFGKEKFSNYDSKRS